MSKKFSRRWEEYRGGLRGILRPSKPLKPQINRALNRVELQIQRINNYIDRYARRDKEIFEKLVQAYERHDNSRVNMLANELAEMRKQKNVLMHSKLSLDNVALRLRTIFEFGNFVSAVTPVVEILQNVRNTISRLMPDVSRELYHAETTLSDIVIEMGQSTSVPFDFEAKSEEAEKIIKEAAIIVESRMNMKLPELPSEASQEGRLVIRRSSDKEEY